MCNSASKEGEGRRPQASKQETPSRSNELASPLAPQASVFFACTTLQHHPKLYSTERGFRDLSCHSVQATGGSVSLRYS